MTSWFVVNHKGESHGASLFNLGMNGGTLECPGEKAGPIAGGT
jgi:hypothetical protein